MDIKEYLKTAILTLQEEVDEEQVNVFNAAFYGSDFSANMNDDTAHPFGHINRILLSGADLSSTTGNYRNRWNIFIYFADLVTLDSTDDQIEDVITAMRNKALLFIAKLNNSGDFYTVEKIDFKHLAMKFDMISAGVLTSITVKEKTPFKIC